MSEPDEGGAGCLAFIIAAALIGVLYAYGSAIHEFGGRINALENSVNALSAQVRP